MESSNGRKPQFSYVSCKIHVQLKIYLIIAYNLHKINVNYVSRDQKFGMAQNWINVSRRKTRRPKPAMDICTHRRTQKTPEWRPSRMDRQRPTFVKWKIHKLYIAAVWRGLQIQFLQHVTHSERHIGSFFLQRGCFTALFRLRFCFWSIGVFDLSMWNRQVPAKGSKHTKTLNWLLSNL